MEEQSVDPVELHSGQYAVAVADVEGRRRARRMAELHRRLIIVAAAKKRSLGRGGEALSTTAKAGVRDKYPGRRPVGSG